MSEKVHYLSLKAEVPAQGYWDQTFIADTLASIPALDKSDREIFIIPGAYQGDIIPLFNRYFEKYDKILVFITSDEEGKFDVEQLRHPDMFVFTQYGQGRVRNWIPLGYTPKVRSLNVPSKKDIQWSFAGQINHERRRKMGELLSRMTGGVYLPTDRFAGGMEIDQYTEIMCRSKAVICPAGNQTQDSFRLYEALEAGAVPIADRFSAQGNDNYWEKIFPDAPFPIYSSVAEIPEMVARAQKKSLQNKVFAWWQMQKYIFQNKIKTLCNIEDTVTVIVPTSPIPSHPSTDIIERTIKSIRHHVGAPVLITIDGIRPEQEAMRPHYEEYIQRLLWKCNFEWKNVYPVLHEKHVHQSGMMKDVLERISSPLVLYVEHDTPLVTDEKIEWELISNMLLDKTAYAVRFHYEAQIPDEHVYLMEPKYDLGDKFKATRQWSQRPHIARRDFYVEAMKFFSPAANCFIEDNLYGKCVEGKWEDWKLYIYTPDKRNIKRSLNLDGRAGDRKFDKEQVW